MDPNKLGALAMEAMLSFLASNRYNEHRLCPVPPRIKVETWHGTKS